MLKTAAQLQRWQMRQLLLERGQEAMLNHRRQRQTFLAGLCLCKQKLLCQALIAMDFRAHFGPCPCYRCPGRPCPCLCRGRCRETWVWQVSEILVDLKMVLLQLPMDW